MSDDAPEEIAMTAPPTLRVIRGDATDEEIAALVAVVGARRRAGTRSGPAPAVASRWRSPARLVRAPLDRGPAAWRASAWPS